MFRKQDRFPAEGGIELSAWLFLPERQAAPLPAITWPTAIRAFSSETDMPPHAYLVSLRVERAKALIREGHSLADVALEVGFSDQSQLTRHFKRHTGLTPGRFAAQTSTPRR